MERLENQRCKADWEARKSKRYVWNIPCDFARDVVKA